MRIRNGVGMSRHINFNVRLYSTGSSIFQHLLQICSRIPQSLSVGTLGSQFWNGGNFEWPRLRVCDVHVKAIEFLPRHGVNDAKDRFLGIKVTGEIHVETTVLEFRLIDNIYWCMGRVYLAICVGVEELIEGLERINHAEKGYRRDSRGVGIQRDGKDVRFIDCTSFSNQRHVVFTVTVSIAIRRSTFG